MKNLTIEKARVCLVLFLGGSLFACGSGEIQSDENPIGCCFNVKTAKYQVVPDLLCLTDPVCPGGETDESDLCDDFCPTSFPHEMTGYLGPQQGVKTVLVWSCSTNEIQTEPVGGAGGDEASEGRECSANNTPIPPGDISKGDTIHFALSSTSGDIELTVGTESETPDYTLEGKFYLSNCYTDQGTGVDYCDLTLYSMNLDTDSTMTFGSTTIVESKTFLAESVTTTVNMTTGAFSFSATDSFTVGVSWEEQGTPSNDEKAANLSNGSDAISGNLDLSTSGPSILFDGTLSGTGGSLDISNVEAPIDNQAPEADDSNTARQVTCTPSTEDPGKTWVELDASASSDPDANIGAHLWYVDEELIGEDATSDVLLAPGSYDVILLVYDDFGAWSSTNFTIDVTDPTGVCE